MGKRGSPVIYWNCVTHQKDLQRHLGVTEEDSHWQNVLRCFSLGSGGCSLKRRAPSTPSVAFCLACAVWPTSPCSPASAGSRSAAQTTVRQTLFTLCLSVTCKTSIITGILFYFYLTFYSKQKLLLNVSLLLIYWHWWTKRILQPYYSPRRWGFLTLPCEPKTLNLKRWILKQKGQRVFNLFN